MAIPLVHGGDLSGVSNVYADRPGAFDEREQTVLQELGDTIADGLAANAARRSRRALLDGMNDAVLVYSLDREQMPTVNRTAVEREDAQISIADNGPGVPDEQKAEVFGKGETGLESDGT